MATSEEENDEKEERKIAQAQRLHEVVRQIRGRLLNSVAVIDVDVSRLLAAYFCYDDKRRDLALSEVFVRPLQLRHKVGLLKKVLEKDFSWYLEKNSQAMFKDLETLMKFRNRLAHSTVDVSDEALGKDPKEEVGFVFYSDGQRHVQKVTPQIVDDLQVKANMTHSRMIELGKILGAKIS